MQYACCAETSALVGRDKSDSRMYRNDNIIAPQVQVWGLKSQLLLKIATVKLVIHVNQ